MAKRILSHSWKGSRSQTEYLASHTELALEELCASFGTQLEQADLGKINNALLVRLSKPVIIHSKRLGPQILQFQYTKFSILETDTKHLKRVYEQSVASRIKRRKKQVTNEEVVDYIQKELGLEKGKEGRIKGLVSSLINNQAVEGMNFKRFGKEVYVGCFESPEKLSFDKEGRLEPFAIHDTLTPGFPYRASFFVKFYVPPRFFISGCAEQETQNCSLSIRWPVLENELSTDLNRAGEIYGIPEKRVFVSNDYEFEPSTSRLATMAFIRSFIKQSLDGTVF